MRVREVCDPVRRIPRSSALPLGVPASPTDGLRDVGLLPLAMGDDTSKFRGTLVLPTLIVGKRCLFVLSIDCVRPRVWPLGVPVDCGMLSDERASRALVEGVLALAASTASSVSFARSSDSVVLPSSFSGAAEASRGVDRYVVSCNETCSDAGEGEGHDETFGGDEDANKCTQTYICIHITRIPYYKIDTGIVLEDVGKA